MIIATTYLNRRFKLPRLTISSIFGAIPFISKMHPALWDKNKIKQTYPAWSHTDGQYVGHRRSPSAVDAGWMLPKHDWLLRLRLNSFRWFWDFWGSTFWEPPSPKLVPSVQKGSGWSSPKVVLSNSRIHTNPFKSLNNLEYMPTCQSFGSLWFGILIWCQGK